VEDDWVVERDSEWSGLEIAVWCDCCIRLGCDVVMTAGGIGRSMVRIITTTYEHTHSVYVGIVTQYGVMMHVNG
jgi:hypothetical protein